MKVYHYTDKTNLDNIMKNGLKSASRYESFTELRKNVVFCWLSPSDNKIFSDDMICLEVTVDEKNCIVASMDYISFASFWISAVVVAVLGFVFWIVKSHQKKQDSITDIDITNMDLEKEGQLFDKLDSMISDYQKSTQALEQPILDDVYPTFFEIHGFICKLENQGKIITDCKKNIKYLQDIITNDGPEYALIINFNSKAFPERKYRIGVCVRGTPLIEKVVDEEK